MSMRRSALALLVACGVVLFGAPAGAVEPPPGSKNFNSPSYVPNYFSNEAGPFQGTPQARSAPPGAGASVAAAPAPRRVAAAAHRGGRHHANGKGRVRLAHGKGGAAKKQVAHAAKGGKARAAVAHAPPRAGAQKSAAAKTKPAAAKAKTSGRAHG